MNGVNYLRNGKIYIGFAVLAIFMILIYPRDGAFPYDYQKGRPWTYETLIAPIDFPVLKTEAEMLAEKEEKSQDVIEFYVSDESIGTDEIRSFSNDAAKAKVDRTVARAITNYLKGYYNNGLVSSFHSLDSYDRIVFVKYGKRVTEVPASNISLCAVAYNAMVSNLISEFGEEAVDTVLNAIDLKSYIVPNLTYDDGTSNLYHRDAINYISPTKGMIYSGQLIVSEGEIITADIEQLLDSYKAEYKMSFGSNVSFVGQLFSHLIYVLAILAILFAIIFLAEPTIFGEMRKLIFILNLFALFFLATVVFYKIDERLLYMMPYAALVLYMGAFFKDATVFPVYVVSLTPVLLISENGVILFMINLVAGSIVLLSFNVFNRGWRQFINIAFIFAGLILTYSAFHILTDSASSFFKSINILYLLVNSILVVVLYPFVYLFEKIYSFVSYSRLWDLADTNNRLLSYLSKKAPGTFQHSLQVSNLSAIAAREIGANSMLVRVGALYHDIGKSENPMCFVENQIDGVNNYHANLSPKESATEIIRHLSTGVALAKKEGLPEILIDFIRAHHGTSRTLYFYNKYCNEGGDPADVSSFTYSGILPQTKEHVILMIADAVEAASRTLKKYDEESVSALVNGIVNVKMSEGQMAEADISLKEIAIVKKSLIDNIMQIYHGRIAYPKRKN